MVLVYDDIIKGSDKELFLDGVKKVASYIGINPNWLMQVMYSESRLKPGAVNPISKATGLIQFMPSTARALGTSIEALQKMSAVDQLYYVQKYFLPYRGKLKSYYDVYAVVFFPAVIGKPDYWVLSTSTLSAEKIAKQNPAINVNKDGVITVKEFKEYVRRTVKSDYRAIIFPTMLIIPIVVLGAIFLAIYGH